MARLTTLRFTVRYEALSCSLNTLPHDNALQELIVDGPQEIPQNMDAWEWAVIILEHLVASEFPNIT